MIECMHWARWNPHLAIENWTVDDLFVTTKSTAPLPLGGRPTDPLALFWRFSPDLLAVLCGFAMNTDGGGSKLFARVLTWLIVPFIILAFIVVVSLQRGDERKNLSRYFLESWPMNLLGYVSYPICTPVSYYIPLPSPDIILPTCPHCIYSHVYVTPC